MNKADLVTAIETRLGGRKAATDAVDAVLDVIIREVARGNKVTITGFGTFEKVTRAARTGRNPRTGETVPIKKSAVPKFKPGTGFKAVVAKPSSLPKTGNAAGRAAAGTAGTATIAATKTAAKKAPTKKAATKTAAAAKKAPAAKTATAAKKATAAKATAAKTTAAKTTATKSAAKKAPAKKATRTAK